MLKLINNWTVQRNPVANRMEGMSVCFSVLLTVLLCLHLWFSVICMFACVLLSLLYSHLFSVLMLDEVCRLCSVLMENEAAAWDCDWKSSTGFPSGCKWRIVVILEFVWQSSQNSLRTENIRADLREPLHHDWTHACLCAVWSRTWGNAETNIKFSDIFLVGRVNSPLEGLP